VCSFITTVIGGGEHRRDFTVNLEYALREHLPPDHLGDQIIVHVEFNVITQCLVEVIMSLCEQGLILNCNRLDIHATTSSSSVLTLESILNNA
jgi:hypothetical protein